MAVFQESPLLARWPACSLLCLQFQAEIFEGHGLLAETCLEAHGSVTKQIYAVISWVRLDGSTPFRFGSRIYSEIFEGHGGLAETYSERREFSGPWLVVGNLPGGTRICA